MLFFLPLLIVSIPVASVVPNYSDSLTRTRFFPAAAAAYSQTPNDCLQRVFQNVTLKRRVEVSCDASPLDSCSGYTAVSHGDRAILLVYRGTNSNFQLLEDFWGTIVEKHMDWISGGWVAHYFYNGFFKLWQSGMKDDLLTLLNKYPSYDLWVTGHSLGAAMAVLASSYAIQVQYVDPKKVTLITFGEPRIGDHQFAASIESQLPGAMRVVHATDFIANEPSKDHHGGFYHHKTEIWYPGDMGHGANYTICSDSAESMSCSDGQPTHSFHDHMWYFDVEFMNYGRGGCKEPV